MQVTLDIITSTMFSANVLAQASEVGPAVSTAAHFTFGRETNPFSLPLSWPTPANRRFAQAREYLDGLIYRLIEERRTSGQQFGDLLDMLLAAQDEETGRGMSDQQLRDEVITIFAAGHETTSNALSWTWHLLAQHPHVRQRLQKELDDVLGGRTPGVEDLAALPYTQAVLEESLRICPPCRQCRGKRPMIQCWRASPSRPGAGSSSPSTTSIATPPAGPTPKPSIRNASCPATPNAPTAWPSCPSGPGHGCASATTWP